MSLRNTDTAYGSLAQSFHWIIALMILVLWCVGLYMTGLEVSPQRLKLYSYHKWAGVTVFALVLARLAWRFISPPPALPAGMSAWEKLAASLGHKLLYLLLFAIPLSGWMMSSAKGYQTVYFGVLPIPDLLSKNPELGKLLEEVHEYLNFFLMAVVAGHAGAALKHHFVDKNNVLARMVPGLKSKS